MPPAKSQDHLNRVRKHAINQMDMSKVDSALDWGCGGGLLAKELTKHCSVNLVDISQESLDKAQEYVGVPCDKFLVDAAVELDLPKVDLILCYSVIQHFPSYEYWQKVSQRWNEIAPKYIAAQIKTRNELKENPNYFKGRNYLNGLFLNRKEIKKAFPSYSIKHWSDSVTPASQQKISFFVLERN
jgi:ubiquinone/menaquinone biosynthesis C-methylase UbiE